jgi:hypothetical protein
MTTWEDYLDQINTDFDVDSPVYSAINIGTGMVLNGNLRQTAGEIQATGVKLDSVSLTTVQTSAESFADNDTSLMTSAAIDDRINAATPSVSDLGVSNFAGSAIQTGSESFADNDTTLMTSAAVQDKIESYGYSTTTGDITGVTAGTGLSGGGASGSVTLNVSGVTLSEIAGASVITSSESFADNDTTVMTSAAIQDKIESYGYTTATGDITGVTAGTGLSGGGASGAVTLNVSGLTVSEFDGASIQTGSESFADNDTTLMTSAAIQDKITSYGYITGVTNISGNAATATALETARNIGGVSFDGTGNIDLAGVNTAGNQNTSGNAATATALATARAINGVDFDGTGAITVTADANTLSGTTLKSSVVNSSLTSVGTLSSLSTGDITLNGTAITATAAELNMLDGSSTAWTTFTPVWEKGITDNGSATINANYLRFGDLCFYEMQMTMGSTTTFHATDLFRMQLVNSGLPTPTAGPTYSSFGGGWVRPTGSGIYSIVPVEVNSDLIFYAQIASGSYVQPTWVKKSTPITWNTSGIIYINGYYRTA